MLNLQKVKEDYCIQQLKEAYQRTYSEMDKGLGNIIATSSPGRPIWPWRTSPIPTPSITTWSTRSWSRWPGRPFWRANTCRKGA